MLISYFLSEKVILITRITFFVEYKTYTKKNILIGLEKLKFFLSIYLIFNHFLLYFLLNNSKKGRNVA
ncbi:MAG: hypothetical protein EAZ06_09560 [Cytophagales bacterium]|nr:MAG: hypothetical protein EAY69_09980 [Cytophagales bacterium]TAH28599.1 MAG: hypothetical protein EAZ06_09560 [Cytophagales bacterium]